jgi:hypothetical protein
MTFFDDPSLKVACPMCGARRGERCKLHSGGPRFESHRDRIDVAKDHRIKIVRLLEALPGVGKS